MSVLLYVHQKRDAFPLSLYLLSNQGSNPSLPNFVTYPLCFLTAHKMTSHPSVLAWATDSKNPDLYYSHYITNVTAPWSCIELKSNHGQKENKKTELGRILYNNSLVRNQTTCTCLLNIKDKIRPTNTWEFKLNSNSQILEEKIHCVTSVAMCQQAWHAFDGIH